MVRNRVVTTVGILPRCPNRPRYVQMHFTLETRFSFRRISRWKWLALVLRAGID